MDVKRKFYGFSKDILFSLISIEEMYEECNKDHWNIYKLQ